MRRLLSIAVALLVLSGGSYALLMAQTRPPQGQFTIYGLGTRSCGEWVTTRANNTSSPYESWVTGYMSGAGAVLVFNTKGNMKKTDTDAIRAFVDNYCRMHPLLPIEQAAAAIVTELLKP